MPYSNSFGIGTQFIGKRDFGSDGSFVTTEFKTFMLPVYPIRTVRVIEGESSTERHLLSRSYQTEYKILPQGKANIKQAASVYGYTAFHLTYFFAAVALIDLASIINPLRIVQIGIVLLPVGIPLGLRFRAKVRPSQSVITMCPCGSGLPYKACCFDHSELLRNRERNFYKKFK